MRLKVNGTSVFILQFTDDQVIITKSKINPEEMTTEIKEEYVKWDLHLNVSKIK